MDFEGRMLEKTDEHVFGLMEVNEKLQVIERKLDAMLEKMQCIETIVKQSENNKELKRAI
jgi:hypothetical protein